MADPISLLIEAGTYLIKWSINTLAEDYKKIQHEKQYPVGFYPNPDYNPNDPAQRPSNRYVPLSPDVDPASWTKEAIEARKLFTPLKKVDPQRQGENLFEVIRKIDHAANQVPIQIKDTAPLLPIIAKLENIGYSGYSNVRPVIGVEISNRDDQYFLASQNENPNAAFAQSGFTDIYCYQETKQRKTRRKKKFIRAI